jgi:putative membrane protein
MSSVTDTGEAPLGKGHVASLPPDATVLAVDRTRLAFERTMMAWVRTATSLITFGFTVYKFFQLEQGAGETPRQHLIGPREFALMMIGIGILSLLLATVQHWQNMSILRVHYRGMRIPLSLAAVVGGFIALLGVLALIAVILKR